jgi:hypothetical protein
MFILHLMERQIQAEDTGFRENNRTLLILGENSFLIIPHNTT